MKISSISSVLPFEKKLKAKCTIDNCRKDPVYIYELDNTKDRHYFRDFMDSSRYKQGRFAELLNRSMIENYPYRKYYVMEDKSNTCLGYCSIYYSNQATDCIEYFETANSPWFDAPRQKNLGRAFMIFLAHNSKKRNKDLFVDYIVPRALPFYRKIGFDIQKHYHPTSGGVGLMKKEDFSKAIKENKKNGNIKISYRI